MATHDLLLTSPGGGSGGNIGDLNLNLSYDGANFPLPPTVTISNLDILIKNGITSVNGSVKPNPYANFSEWATGSMYDSSDASANINDILVSNDSGVKWHNTGPEMKQILVDAGQFVDINEVKNMDFGAVKMAWSMLNGVNVLIILYDGTEAGKIGQVVILNASDGSVVNTWPTMPAISNSGYRALFTFESESAIRILKLGGISDLIQDVVMDLNTGIMTNAILPYFADIFNGNSRFPTSPLKLSDNHYFYGEASRQHSQERRYRMLMQSIKVNGDSSFKNISTLHAASWGIPSFGVTADNQGSFRENNLFELSNGYFAMTRSGYHITSQYTNFGSSTIEVYDKEVLSSYMKDVLKATYGIVI